MRWVELQQRSAAGCREGAEAAPPGRHGWSRRPREGMMRRRRGACSGAAQMMAAACLRAELLVRLAWAAEVFSDVDVSTLFGAGNEEASVSVGCQPDGTWGAPASTLLYELPGAGTSDECQELRGTRSVCSTPKLGASGCELLANTAGCTCNAFCEHHGLVCEASWDDNYKMCIKRTDDQFCKLGAAEQICLCVPHDKPPLVSAAELVAILGASSIAGVILAMWIYCHGKVPECKLWSSKSERVEAAAVRCMHTCWCGLRCGTSCCCLSIV